MAKAVLIQNPTSIYADEIGATYDFTAIYLNRIQQTVGDWVILYEARGGAFGYVAVQKIMQIVPKPGSVGRYLAIVERGSLLEFERVVPRDTPLGRAYEPVLRGPDGRAMLGGANSAAVRMIDPLSFAGIIDAGLTATTDHRDTLPRQPVTGLAEGAVTFVTDRTRQLSDRAFRDAAFSRMVRLAYDGRCAVSGLSLRNGGGRPEVAAAHIVPVADGGPDVVANGLALSGTLHWMFDRGLIAVAEDHSVLVSHNKVPADVVRRLIDPEQRLILPQNPRYRPHPDFLRWHRENVFGRGEPLPL